MALKDLGMHELRARALSMGMTQAHVDTARNTKQLVFMIENYQPAPPPPPQPPAEPKKATTQGRAKQFKKSNLGIKKNTEQKNRKDAVSVGNSFSIIPLAAKAFNYKGLRIS